MVQECLNYRLSRRTVLGASSGMFLGLSVRNLIARGGVDHAPRAEHVILFWNSGGMTHLDTWDPKPGRPTQGEFEPIKTSAEGVEISEIFPLLAKQMHHASLIRSIAGTNGDHGRATYQLQTSYDPFPNLQHPGLGSVIVHETSPIGDLPAYISISAEAPRAGYLGQGCEAYYVGRPGERDPYLAFPTGINEVRGDKRLELLARYNAKTASRAPRERLKDNETAREQAVSLMKSPALEAFDLEKVSPRTIERYGENEFGRGALLAGRLVEKGVRFVQVNRGGFDTHTGNFPALRAHGEVMDPALASLVEDLAESGLLKKTLIVMLSEFGRTPTINRDAGRDHWPNVFSCFLAGGGIPGGTVLGSSDKDGEEAQDHPVKVADIHATICHILGIDPAKEVMTPLSRPLKLVNGGTPISELIG